MLESCKQLFFRACQATQEASEGTSCSNDRICERLAVGQVVLGLPDSPQTCNLV